MEKDSTSKSFPFLIHQIDHPWMHDQFDMRILNENFQSTSGFIVVTLNDRRCSLKISSGECSTRYFVLKFQIDLIQRIENARHRPVAPLSDLAFFQQKGEHIRVT